MGQMQCDTQWIGGIGFEAKVRGHKFIMDSTGDYEQQDRGPSPKELLLASICGCSGMDVVAILQKMRVDLTTCQVLAKTETSSGYPSIFTEVKLQFLIQSPNVKIDQAIKAVTLSMTKYCGVSAMVVNSSPITYEIFVNGEQVGSGRSDFSGASA